MAFTHQFPTPGDYVLQVQTSHDDLEADDVRSVVVRVRNTVSVMIVNGKPAPERFDRASEWVRVALNPFADGRETPPGIVARPKVISVAQFADEKTGDLTDVDAVFLCDVPRFLGAAEVRRLEAHVRRGGALLIGMGDQVDLGNYNDLLFARGEGLLPARLLGVQPAGPGYSFQLTMDPEADRLDPLRAFQDSAARVQLLAPAFSKFVRCDPAKPQRGVAPRKLLGFMPVALPGRPGPARAAPPVGGAAVLEWAPPLPGKAAERDRPQTISGRGRVVLFTSTLNADWNRWPASRAFPAFLQETLFHAASARLRERSIGAGEPIELFLTTPALVEAAIDAPRERPAGEAEDGPIKLSTQALGDGSVLRFGDTDLAGVYKIRLGANPREHLYAVNVPASSEDQKQSESNLARTNKDELGRTYPEWDVQVVEKLEGIQHAQGGAGNVTFYTPQGNFIACESCSTSSSAWSSREILLAWQFGHYSGSGTLAARSRSGPRPVGGGTALRVRTSACSGPSRSSGSSSCTTASRATSSGSYPTRCGRGSSGSSACPPRRAARAAAGGSKYTSFLYDAKADPWLVGGLVLLCGAAVVMIYRQEGNGVSAGYRLRLVCLRVGVLMLLLIVLLPQLSLHFERQGWPDLAILIDDSQSMTTLDSYREAEVRTAADGPGRAGDVDRGGEGRAGAGRRQDAERRGQGDADARLAPAAGADASHRRRRLLAPAGDARAAGPPAHLPVQHAGRAGRRRHLRGRPGGGRPRPSMRLRSNSSHDSSQLGAAVRQVLNDFRGASLSGIVLLTDGVTTEGEDLAGVAKYAAQMGVPLFFVGIGDAHEQRDLSVHDLQVRDSTYVNDRLIFALRVTGQGFDRLTVPVTLYEKGKDRVLDSKSVTIEPGAKTVKVQLVHRPTEPGEKVYVIRVPVQEGEIDRENNQIEREVDVVDTKQIKVLYVEGYRRYEYHYLKTLLERENARVKGNKSINLRVVLLDADADAPGRTGRSCPTASRRRSATRRSTRSTRTCGPTTS